MLAREPVAPPPPGAGSLVDALMERVHGFDSSHSAVAAAIARGEPPPTVPAPTDIELLDPQSRQLAAHTDMDDPWVAWGMVDLLRTRALIAEITISLIGLRDL